jgi:hypothetical protein
LVLEALEVPRQSVELAGHPTTRVLSPLAGEVAVFPRLQERRQQTPAALVEVRQAQQQELLEE